MLAASRKRGENRRRGSEGRRTRGTRSDGPAAGGDRRSDRRPRPPAGRPDGARATRWPLAALDVHDGHPRRLGLAGRGVVDRRGGRPALDAPARSSSRPRPPATAACSSDACAEPVERRADRPRRPPSPARARRRAALRSPPGPRRRGRPRRPRSPTRTARPTRPGPRPPPRRRPGRRPRPRRPAPKSRRPPDPGPRPRRPPDRRPGPRPGRRPDVAVILPDGQIGWPDGLVYTDRPFVPPPSPRCGRDLLAGEFAGFHAIETTHYLVLYQGSHERSPRPAARSWRTSTTGLDGLPQARRPGPRGRVPAGRRDLPDRGRLPPAQAGRPRRPGVLRDPQNRIFLYETSTRDESAPEVAALRKPQTVAHEGTHQILQNIGVQPRLADWPLWLVEGLAEYCCLADDRQERRGRTGRARPGQPPPPGDDPRPRRPALGPGRRAPTSPDIGRDPGMPLVEYLVTRTELTPDRLRPLLGPDPLPGMQAGRRRSSTSSAR